MSKWIMIIAASTFMALMLHSKNDISLTIYHVGSVICIGFSLILNKLQK